MNLHPSSRGVQRGDFITLGVNSGAVPDETIIRRAVWVYATYRAHGSLSHGESLDPTQTQELLKQFAREAVRGNSHAGSIIDGSFARGRLEFQEALDSWDIDG